jgi:hypothetical protein
MKEFARRQLLLFAYDLNPSGCHPRKEWKCELAGERWRKLKDSRDKIAGGGLKDLALRFPGSMPHN